jgi:hypothetical protein
MYHGAARIPFEEDVTIDYHRANESEQDLEGQPLLNEQAIAGELETGEVWKLTYRLVCNLCVASAEAF